MKEEQHKDEEQEEDEEDEAGDEEVDGRTFVLVYRIMFLPAFAGYLFQRRTKESSTLASSASMTRPTISEQVNSALQAR